MKAWMQSRENKYTLILTILYTVGIVGMIFFKDSFASLTPFNLIITALLLFLPHQNLNLPVAINLLLVFLASYILEVMGVKSGAIFGNYSYGDNLGFKLLETPLLIGLNWCMLAYASLNTVQTLLVKFRLKSGEVAASAMAAAIMLLLDSVIEPVAPLLDYWEFQNNMVPIQNYTAWFFFGFAFCFWLLKSGSIQNNSMGWRVITIQLLFFIILQIVL